MKYVENEKLNLLIKFAMYDYEDPDVKEFKNYDDSEVVLSKKYYAKKKRLLNKYRMRQKMLSVKKVISAVSVACLIIVLSIGISIVSVSSLRNAVWNAIVKWYEDYITIRYEMPDDDIVYDTTEQTDDITDQADYTTDQSDDDTTEQTVSGITEETGVGDMTDLVVNDTTDQVADDVTEQSTDEYSTVEEEAADSTSTSPPAVSVPTKIETVKKPTYLPEGVEEEQVINNSVMVVYEYYSGDAFVFYYTQTIYTEDDKYFDSETAKVREIQSGEDKFLLIEYYGNPEKILLWDDRVYLYKVSFEDISIDEMIKIAKSVE